jgi:aminoglycoside 3-N-acetyltransferase I
VGRQVVADLRARAAVHGVADLFLAADNNDVHAFDFYRASGGAPSAVTFSFAYRDK